MENAHDGGSFAEGTQVTLVNDVVDLVHLQQHKLACGRVGSDSNRGAQGCCPGQ
jgi:hypothetical protein